jgi:hypothetical protein
MLEDIVRTMKDLDVFPGANIHKGTILEWMAQEDIQALGAVYYLIMDRRYYPRIKPPLKLADYKDFLLHYFGRCFLEDPQLDWTCSRYSAGWDLGNWFRSLWQDHAIPRRTLAEIKDWLGQVYKEADTGLRTCIVTATLEHIIEDRAVAKFFSDWEKDPVLKDAYLEALVWSRGTV